MLSKHATGAWTDLRALKRPRGDSSGEFYDCRSKAKTTPSLSFSLTLHYILRVSPGGTYAGGSTACRAKRYRVRTEGGVQARRATGSRCVGALFTNPRQTVVPSQGAYLTMAVQGIPPPSLRLKVLDVHACDRSATCSCLWGKLGTDFLWIFARVSSAQFLRLVLKA